MASVSDGLAHRALVFGLEDEIFVRQNEVWKGFPRTVGTRATEAAGGRPLFLQLARPYSRRTDSKGADGLFSGEATPCEEPGSSLGLARASAIESASCEIDTLRPYRRPDCSPLYRNQPTLGARCTGGWEILGDSRQTPSGELTGG